ncbi:hypothetical protein H5410_020022 [Solanum commersonii]|uniref:Uncharacterized protein n=1 Tax=Solanum commersonii TaxID=4109 RepID=A0A9J5Z8Z1_SOLCO|nr:hypothetical protein H5410_020022 [Solanum commersonii]
MKLAYIISFLLIISLNIYEAKARSIQQYDNSYKKLFSQFKVARELRGVKGQKTTMTPPEANKGSGMHLPPTAPLPRQPPPPPLAPTS